MSPGLRTPVDQWAPVTPEYLAGRRFVTPPSKKKTGPSRTHSGVGEGPGGVRRQGEATARHCKRPRRQTGTPEQRPGHCPQKVRGVLFLRYCFFRVVVGRGRICIARPPRGSRSRYLSLWRLSAKHLLLAAGLRCRTLLSGRRKRTAVPGMNFAALCRADCRLSCCACGTILWLSELGLRLHFAVCAEEAYSTRKKKKKDQRSVRKRQFSRRQLRAEWRRPPNAPTLE